MGETTKKVAGVVAIIVTIGLIMYFISHVITDRDTKAKCVAYAGEICPGNQFYYDYKEWESLKADLDKRHQSKEVIEFQNEVDLITGMTQRLNATVPQGYTWDADKMKFIQKPPANTTPNVIVQPPTQPPSNAPPPKR